MIGRLVDNVDHAVSGFALVHDAPCGGIRRRSGEGPCEETRAERSVRPHNSGAGRAFIHPIGVAKSNGEVIYTFGAGLTPNLEILP